MKKRQIMGMVRSIARNLPGVTFVRWYSGPGQKRCAVLTYVKNNLVRSYFFDSCGGLHTELSGQYDEDIDFSYAWLKHHNLF